MSRTVVRVRLDHPIRKLRVLADTILQELNTVLASRELPVVVNPIPPERLLSASLLQVVYSVRSERLLKEAKFSYLASALMQNRYGLLVGIDVRHASGTGWRDGALALAHAHRTRLRLGQDRARNAQAAADRATNGARLCDLGLHGLQPDSSGRHRRVVETVTGVRNGACIYPAGLVSASTGYRENQSNPTLSRQQKTIAQPGNQRFSTAC